VRSFLFLDFCTLHAVYTVQLTTMQMWGITADVIYSCQRFWNIKILFSVRKHIKLAFSLILLIQSQSLNEKFIFSGKSHDWLKQHFYWCPLCIAVSKECL